MTQTVFQPTHTHTESAPINPRGDRLLVRGEPGRLERLTQLGRYRARVQAEERILTFLERLPYWDTLDYGQQELTVRLVLSVARQTVREDRERMVLMLQSAGRLLGADLCVPDPRDTGHERWMLRQPAHRDLLETEAESGAEGG